MESTKSDPELDDDFSEIYKEYTGPQCTVTNNIQEKEKPIKQPEEACDEEEQQLPDPNSVPTDFTSREAKVWEAKSKATERNWKKRKEEEMICKICGESGHFTQGCPSTLGANRKSQEFLERVPARDKNVRVLFTEKVIERIEKETGCKIKMDEKFLIVSGKDRLVLRKGVDAVHKVKEDGEIKTSSASHRSRSRSPRRASVGPPRARNSEPLRQHPPPPHGFSERPGRQDKFMENRVRENQRNASRGSPQAYGSERARSRSTHSKSPGRPRYSGWDKPYDRQKSEVSGYRSERWDQERMGGSGDIQVSHQFERPAFPQTLEELELEYTRDAMELAKKREKEEDEENNKHRETMRELRESYMKKLAGLRGVNAKQWEEFLQQDAQRRQQQARQQSSGLSYGSNNYRQFPPYADQFDDGYSANPPPYGGNNVPMDSEGRYPNHVKNYSSRHQDNNYGTGFQRQRRGDYGKAYNHRY
uniref:CCHC-type domain-containing protein n=1 Tax=Noccaea caerulescens TaxID=107243 RepID=A0A1J3GPE4_NOCCA